MANLTGMHSPKVPSTKKLHIGGLDPVTKAEYKEAKRSAHARRSAGEQGLTWRDALDDLRNPKPTPKPATKKERRSTEA